MLPQRAVGLVTTSCPDGGSRQRAAHRLAGRDERQAAARELPRKKTPTNAINFCALRSGVEEVRKDKDGVIESRQWKIAETSGNPIWIVARSQSEDSPKSAWHPKPGITNLLFNPPLNEVLEPDKPEYLAYAPADVVNVSDSEQFDSMTTAFGAGIGTFKWRDRSYTYVLVKELPCFKPAKEK